MAKHRRKDTSPEQHEAAAPAPAVEAPAPAETAPAEAPALAPTLPPPATPPVKGDSAGPGREYVCVYRLSGAVKGAIGSTVRLPAAEAERLLKLGAIRPVK